MKSGFGVKIRESSGEAITLSTLYGPGELKRGMKINVEPTHDKHAQGTGQDPSTCYQNPFEVGFVLLRHLDAAPTDHEPERRWKTRG